MEFGLNDPSASSCAKYLDRPEVADLYYFAHFDDHVSFPVVAVIQ